MSLSVLLEMELAALPGYTGERFSKGFTNPLVIITGDAIRPVHPSHHEALKEAGRFRSGGVGVMAGNQVIHMDPPAHLVPWQIKDLFTWYQESDLHPLVKSTIFHNEFEFIHPFADGNGHMGRMWHTLLLGQWKTFFAWLPIEEFIAKRQSEYYKACKWPMLLAIALVLSS